MENQSADLSMHTVASGLAQPRIVNVNRTKSGTARQSQLGSSMRSDKFLDSMRGKGYHRRRSITMTCLSLFVFLLASCASKLSTSEPPASPATPVSWTGVDVGSVGTRGETYVDAHQSSLTVLGAGTDIWGTSDAFHMAAETVTGDATVIGRVDYVEEIEDWTKAGIMFRESLDAGSKNIFIHVTPKNGAVMQARSVAGAETMEPGWDHGLRPPIWLKLERKGDVFTGSYSADGESWTILGTTSFAMSEEFYVGLAVTSKNPSALAQAGFAEVRLEGTNRPAVPADPEPTPPGKPVPAPGTPGGERVTSSFSASSAPIPNPERGWYFERTSAEYSEASQEGFTLALRYVNLSSYRNTATLPSSVFSGLQADLDRARQAGLKIILRFAYNRSRDADAPLQIVLAHISQAGQFIRDNADVIAVVQAGFIGAWGEWHSSTNNLLTVENHTRISHALLDAIPESRMIQLRKPQYVRELFPMEGLTGTSRSFDGSDESRVGLMNDCFLTSSSDSGTFLSEDDFSLFANVGRFTAVGGETCDLAGLVPRNDCPTALTELTKYHWDYLNHDFWRPIIDRWRTSGCYTEISSRLGYRYELVTASAPSHLVPGKGLDLEVVVRNTGFGKLFNPRPIQVLLVNATTGSIVVLDGTTDARKVLPLSGDTATLHLNPAVPQGTPAGSYFLYLKLPDAAQNLQSDWRYSIRMANSGVWDSSLGANDLGLWVSVE